MTDRPDISTARGGRILMGAILAWFALQVVLRLVLGGAYETDEAEMLVMTPDYRLGYGPQLPLYNWAQLTLFHVFGRDLFALSLLKNLLLALTYLLTFAGLRLLLPLRAAVVGTLALFLVPDIAWEAERATTHSNMMLAASAGVLAALAFWLRRGTLPAALLLGVALGIGGLSKYNFWLVPVALMLAGLTLPALRARLFRPALLAALPVAALILWAPMAWLVAQRNVALASTAKLQIDSSGGRFAGVPDLVSGLASLMVLPLLVLGVALLVGRLRGRATQTAAPNPAPAPEAALALRWLGRAALIAGLLVLAGVVAAGMGNVASRWLLPVAFLAAPALMARGLWARPAGGAGAMAIAAGLVAVVVLAGLAIDRSKEGARRDVDFAGLPERLAQVAPAGTPVVAEFFTAGNLAHLRPDWPIAPLLNFAAGRFTRGPVLFVMREGLPRDLDAALAQGGWPGGATVLAEGSFTLPYMSHDKSMPFRYVLAEPVRN